MGAAQESFLVADQQHLGEDDFDAALELLDKAGQRAVVRSDATGERHESHILLAGTLQPARADEPTRVNKQYDFQKQLLRIGWATELVIGVKVLKPRVGDPLLNKMMERMFEAARSKLLLQNQRHHQALPVIVWLEARHGKDYQSARRIFHPKTFENLLFRQPQPCDAANCSSLSCLVLTHEPRQSSAVADLVL